MGRVWFLSTNVLEHNLISAIKRIWSNFGFQWDSNQEHWDIRLGGPTDKTNRLAVTYPLVHRV